MYSTILEEKRVQDFYFYLYWTIPLILVVSFLLALILQKHIARPVKRMADVIQQSSYTHEFNQRMDEGAASELGVLAGGFNRLMETVQQTQAQLYADNERLRVTLESIAEGVITTNQSGAIEYMNPVAEDLIHCKESNAVGKPLDEVFQLIDENTGEAIVGQIDECLQAGVVKFNMDDVCLVTPKQHLPVQSSIAPIRDVEGNTSGAVVVFRNVSQARDLARKLEHQASHDGLTDLINRNEFEVQLTELVTSFRKGQTHALIYLDLDQFKIVNDTSGHLAGDSMLRQVAGIIRNHVRESDIVARLGGMNLVYYCRGVLSIKPKKLPQNCCKLLVNSVSNGKTSCLEWAPVLVWWPFPIMVYLILTY